MNLSLVFATILLPLFSFAFNIRSFKASSQVSTTAKYHAEIPSSTSEFHPAEFLDSRVHKPEIYNDAMIGLNLYNRKPHCYQLAVQLHLEACQDLERRSEDRKYQVENEDLLNHQVDTFGISLALCDMERADFELSDACTPFTSSAMTQRYNEGKDSVEVTPEQVNACLRGLRLDKQSSPWLTYTNSRKEALLFCRAARVDIEKEQAILLNKQLMDNMQDFLQNWRNDVENTQQTMADRDRMVASYMTSFMTQIELLNAKIQSTFGGVSDDMTAIKVSQKSVLNSFDDMHQVINKLFQTADQSNAQMAARHHHDLAVANSNAESSIGIMLAIVENFSARMNRTFESLELSLLQREQIRQADREAAIDKKYEALHTLMSNLTMHVKEQNELILDNNVNLKVNYASVGSWNGVFHSNSAFGDYVLRAGLPLLALMLGNYGLTPSLSRNAALLLGGYLTAESIVQFWRWDLSKMVSTTTSTAPAYKSAEPSLEKMPIYSLLPSSTPTKSEDDCPTCRVDLT